MVNGLIEDLELVLSQTHELWEEVRGSRIFITGGTGFFGCWLLESLVFAGDRLRLDVQAVVLTRNPEMFREKAPHLADHPSIVLHVGDVRDFSFPEGRFSHVVHAATEASATMNKNEPLRMLDTIVEGTRHTLDFAVACGASKFLLTSSGAVYGKQPSAISHIPEDYAGAPDSVDSVSAYGEGKRLAELLCSIYARQFGLQTKIARCFAFVGPYLPLDGDFAVGNFLRDALNGEPVQVAGDGLPLRSYLYGADLATWLWTILFSGDSCSPYNVGSDEAVSINELADLIAELFQTTVSRPNARPTLPPSPPPRYVPSVHKAEKSRMGLRRRVGLEDSLRRTFAWHAARRAVCR